MLLILGWTIYLRQALLMILTPFLISFILAYVLTPLVQFMERRGGAADHAIRHRQKCTHAPPGDHSDLVGSGKIVRYRRPDPCIACGDCSAGHV